MDQDASAEGLVMLLHGAGDSAEGLQFLAEEWCQAMPRVAFVLPSAPHRGQSTLWFARSAPPSKQLVGEGTITRQLLELLASERQRLRLRTDQVALWGYSAGSLMAAWVALHLPEHCACLVCVHGTVPKDRLPPPPPCPAGPRPAALVLAGGVDVQMPPHAVDKAVQELTERHGFTNVTYLIEEGQGHAISDGESDTSLNFIRLHLCAQGPCRMSKEKENREAEVESHQEPAGSMLAET